MNVVGVDIITGHQDRRALEQARARRAAFTIRRVNTGNTQNMNGRASTPTKKAHQTFRMHAALGTRGIGVQGTCLAHPFTLAITIHPAG